MQQEETFAKVIVCIQTAACPEIAVCTWWSTYGETENITSRGRALSLKANDGDEMEDSFQTVDENLRPYSSVLHEIGELIVADTEIPECIYATKWGRVTVFKARDKSEIILTVTRHPDCGDTHNSQWAARACMETTLYITRWVGSSTWPHIKLSGYADVCPLVCDVANHLNMVSACTDLSIWVVAPEGSHWPIPKLRHVCVHALYHGSDGKTDRVPGANEFWLQGKRETCTGLSCCCGSRKPVEDNHHKLSAYARDLWKCIEQR